MLGGTSELNFEPFGAVNRRQFLIPGYAGRMMAELLDGRAYWSSRMRFWWR
jgi:hypothetical protein